MNRLTILKCIKNAYCGTEAHQVWQKKEDSTLWERTRAWEQLWNHRGGTQGPYKETGETALRWAGGAPSRNPIIPSKGTGHSHWLLQLCNCFLVPLCFHGGWGQIWSPSFGENLVSAVLGEEALIHSPAVERDRQQISHPHPVLLTRVRTQTWEQKQRTGCYTWRRLGSLQKDGSRRCWGLKDGWGGVFIFIWCRPGAHHGGSLTDQEVGRVMVCTDLGRETPSLAR